MIIDHTNPKYIEKCKRIGNSRFNGAYYYSKEIIEYFIPRIKTNRNWVTLNIEGECVDDAIVFIHNRLHPEWYEWLSDYKNLILVCAAKENADRLSYLGETIYLPLSVDVKYVRQFIKPKDKEVAYVGRREKLREIKGSVIPKGIPIIGGVPRVQLLNEMARYKKIYAVDRTAIEGKILGCEILPYEPNYPDPGFWKILDSSDAAEILEEKLREIDG